MKFRQTDALYLKFSPQRIFYVLTHIYQQQQASLIHST